MSAQEKPRCIWCGEANNLSGEHILPNWISQRFPEIAKQAATQFQAVLRATIQPEGATQADEVKNWDEQAPFAQRKLWKVCISCNNGWMSALQVRAMDQVTELMNGVWNELDHSGALTLAQWLMMISVNIDASYPDTQSTPEAVRRAFRRSLTLPANSAFLMGRMSGGPGLSYSKRSFTSIGGHFRLGAPFSGHCITVTLKQLIMQAILIPADDPHIDATTFIQHGREVGLFPLSPWGGRVLNWREVPFNTSQEIPKIVEYFGLTRAAAIQMFAAQRAPWIDISRPPFKYPSPKV